MFNLFGRKTRPPSQSIEVSAGSGTARADAPEDIFSDLLWNAAGLVSYANARHGYRCDGYAVTYHTDLDGYLIEVEGMEIPEGFVQVSHGLQNELEFQITEDEYLTALRRYLLIRGKNELALELKGGQPVTLTLAERVQCIVRGYS